MAGILRVPRSRGALSGVLLVLLGAWGALIPLVGPYFHYAYTPDTAWSLTSGRIWLEIAPGAVAFIGGLIVLISSLRPVAMFGLSPLWTTGGVSAIGSPVGGTVARTAEQIGFFTGLGVVIAFLAALVIGRLSVVGVRDARLAESRDARQAAARLADEGEALPARDTAARDTAARDTAVRDTATTGHTTVDESGAGDEAADPVVYDATAGRSAAADPVAADSAAEETSATRA